MDPVQCKAEFRVEKNALRSVAETPDLRHRILNWISENQSTEDINVIDLTEWISSSLGFSVNLPTSGLLC